MLPLLEVSLILCLVIISYKKWAKQCHHKCGMILSSQVFACKYCPWVSCPFCENEWLECEIKVSLVYYSAFYQHHTQKLYQKLQYPDFSYPDAGVIFYISILSRSQKLADVYPPGTLDSCSGTQNEQKNTHNTVIESEIRTLSM